jgi:hypothetical protein
MKIVDKRTNEIIFDQIGIGEKFRYAGAEFIKIPEVLSEGMKFNALNLESRALYHFFDTSKIKDLKKIRTEVSLNMINHGEFFVYQSVLYRKFVCDDRTEFIRQKDGKRMCFATTPMVEPVNVNMEIVDD